MMRLTKEALSINVIVRRVSTGANPYRWEIHRVDTLAVVHVSPDRFRSMEAAYAAGQARLQEFIPTRSFPPGVTLNRQWQSRQIGPAKKDLAAAIQ